MLKYNLYNDLNLFYNDVLDVLLLDESLNMILLGNLKIGIEGTFKYGWRDPKNWLMATVTNETQIVLVALMTPPHNITLYTLNREVNKDVINCLVVNLKVDVPGVIAYKLLALEFANTYQYFYNKRCEITMNQMIYDIIFLNPVKIKGKIRLINERDLSFLPYWLKAFNNSDFDNLDYYIKLIESEKIYVLEIDSLIVSMAGFNRVLDKALGIAYVYTPPYLRNNGYATSIVSQLTQIAFNKGFERCVLYTDLSNKTANSIYQKIGYTPVCESMQIKFLNS